MAKVLVIGSGGREHALAWKLSRSPKVDRVYAAPGNGGMADVAECVNIGVNDFDELIQFAKSEVISLTVVGPEVPLANGIVDRFLSAGVKVFGPTQKAALIESSKGFMKDLLVKYKIPTAKYGTFKDLDQALNFLSEMSPPFVIKADGLAQGKGVIITSDKPEADQTIKEILTEKKFDSAGNSIIIEKYMDGREFSYITLVNGRKFYPLLPAVDYKRAYDGDKGLNTGGMGAYAPVPWLSEKAITESNIIIQKTINALADEGRPFTGFLFGGFTATASGVKVIEFNARSGDPETEVLMPLLESDLYTILTDILSNKEPIITWKKTYAVGHILAAKGYPSDYEKGFPITGFDRINPETNVFHCGTKKSGEDIVSSGGRVLFVACKAGNIYEARENMYIESDKLMNENLFRRNDIGKAVQI